MSAPKDPSGEPYSPYNRREDAPLPPVPSTTVSTTPRPRDNNGNVSPVELNSPFSDHAYPSQPRAQPAAGGAAADYFNEPPHSPVYGQPTQYGQSAPPAQHGQYHNDSPFSQDTRYGQDPSPSPYSDSRPLRYPNDPFDDHNAIPLQQKPVNGRYGAEEMGVAGGSAYDADQRRRMGDPRLKPKRKSGWLARPIPFVIYTLTTVQIIVFIAQIIRNAVLTGTPIGIKPQFNPMIGPSWYVIINMGARYVPCMRNTDNVQNNPSTDLFFPCPNTTTSSADCHLSDLCGFNGVPNPVQNGSLTDTPAPNQWWWFITPIFLHGGLIHIGFNLLLQMTMGKDMERLIGSIRMFLVYFASGIFGFVFGGNFATTGTASVGASGAIFGILALTLLDLLYHWGERRSPGKELAFIILDVVIAFVLGLLPGMDNFSHIGGFLMGLVLGICLLRSPSVLQQRIGGTEPPYAAVSTGEGKTSLASFAKQPVGFFKGRKPLWWVWWILRAGALAAVLAVFIVLIQRFYDPNAKACTWCKYLSCLPVNNGAWCDLGNLTFTDKTTKRSLPDFTLWNDNVPELLPRGFPVL